MGRVFAKTELRWVLPSDSPCTGIQVGDVAIHERRVQLSPEIAVRATDRLWVNAGLSTTISGRNSLAGTQWSVGVSWIRR